MRSSAPLWNAQISWADVWPGVELHALFIQEHHAARDLTQQQAEHDQPQEGAEERGRLEGGRQEVRVTLTKALLLELETYLRCFLFFLHTI